ncbi:arrestin red cell-like isoform X2 [Stigmatopora argus]
MPNAHRNQTAPTWATKRPPESSRRPAPTPRLAFIWASATLSTTWTTWTTWTQLVSRAQSRADPRNDVTVLGADGVILVDPEYLQDRKVFVSLACVFRYGREDVDVLGLSFRKDLHVSTLQAFPPVLEPKPLSSLQEKLLRKLGANAHPFRFGIPENLPCSVTLQPGPEDTGKACGVDYELKAYCARAAGEKLHPRNSVQLVIRKVQYAPEKKGPQPVAECSRGFLLSERPLQLEASLDKELYYHGEAINVNVHVSNNSSKTVRKVKIAVRQYADICLFSKAQYKCPVAQLEADEQVCASSTFCQVYTLTPSMGANRLKRGLALDGKLKHQDTNLASSTIICAFQNERELQQGGVGHRGVLQGQSQTGGFSRERHLVGASLRPDASQTQRPATSGFAGRRGRGGGRVCRPRGF